MKFYSTNNNNYRVGLEEAVRLGLPDDEGLFMPEVIPQLPDSFYTDLSKLSMAEIGYEILWPYVQNVVPGDILQNICSEAFSFPVPLVELKENLYSL